MITIRKLAAQDQQCQQAYYQTITIDLLWTLVDGNKRII